MTYALLKKRLYFFYRFLKFLIVLLFPRGRVHAMARIGRITEQATEQATGYIQQLVTVLLVEP